MNILLNSPNDFFSAQKYLGIVRFSNIRLRTINQYVYSLFLSANISYTAFDRNGIPIPNFNPSGLTSFAVANLDVSSVNYNASQNCTITNPPTLNITHFSLTGVPIR
jgi:hypothetical protein